MWWTVRAATSKHGVVASSGHHNRGLEGARAGGGWSWTCAGGRRARGPGRCTRCRRAADGMQRRGWPSFSAPRLALMRKHWARRQVVGTHCGPRGGDQGGLDPGAALGHPGGSTLAGALVAARTQPRPGHGMACRWAARHGHADLRHASVRRKASTTRRCSRSTVRRRSVMRPRSTARNSAVLLRAVPCANAARHAGSDSPSTMASRTRSRPAHPAARCRV